MTVGEVYFVQEFPNPNEEPTKLVKIGLVGKEGHSKERLKQHQTGNPRRLKLKHVVLTPDQDGLKERCMAVFRLIGLDVSGLRSSQAS